MYKNNELINNLIKEFEVKGEIAVNNGLEELFIEAMDDKGGYSYASSINKEFKDSREAQIEKLKE
ncbi:hypothetical protein [Clostridium thermarum]|uniref:hypothetical protein n=1 Tax=Clostridium thermarum TaxID=1716543 RepID=UPI001123CE79|nr:hypothetical protein [Clostridium thermarum]